jgi:hypothetical protein
MLPVKRPEANPALIPCRQRDLAALCLYEINAKSLPPDLNGNKKNDRQKKIFPGVQIQDLIVDVL